MSARRWSARPGSAFRRVTRMLICGTGRCPTWIRSAPAGGSCRTWSTVSASFLLAGLAVIVLGGGGALLPTLAVLALAMLVVEAFARGHLVQFALAVIAAAAVGAVAWAVAQAAIGSWREVVAALLALAALVLLVANVRDFFAKR